MRYRLARRTVQVDGERLLRLDRGTPVGTASFELDGARWQLSTLGEGLYALRDGVQAFEGRAALRRSDPAEILLQLSAPVVLTRPLFRTRWQVASGSTRLGTAKAGGPFVLVATADLAPEVPTADALMILWSVWEHTRDVRSRQTA